MNKNDKFFYLICSGLSISLITLNGKRLSYIYFLLNLFDPILKFGYKVYIENMNSQIDRKYFLTSW